MYKNNFEPGHKRLSGFGYTDIYIQTLEEDDIQIISGGCGYLKVRLPGVSNFQLSLINIQPKIFLDKLQH